MKHGGARKGAGRPASGRSTEVLSVRVPAEMAEELRQQANRKDAAGETITLSRVVSEAIEKGLKRK